MVKERRVFQDETLFGPLFRHWYGRFILGRPGDSNEEPVKFTQTLHYRNHYDCMNEWVARVPEQGWLSASFKSGRFEHEQEAMKRLDEFMDATGIESELESMMDDGAEGANAAMSFAEDTLAEGTGLEVIETVFSKEMAYGFYMYPPVIPIPLAMSPAVNTMVFGQSSDITLPPMNFFTSEIMWAVIWHVEEGLQTDLHFWGLDGEQISLLERRHMRTGEKFRNLLVPRPTVEGAMMTMDVLKDLRNERAPKHSKDPMYFHGAPSGGCIDADPCCGSRSFFELIPFLNVYKTREVGFPFQTYTGFVPRPGLFDLLLQLPIDMLGPRFISIFAGAEIWMPRYTLTHLETHHEVIGEEAIPPTWTESMSAYIRYGMDMFRYPASFEKAKYLYGQNAQVRVPTEYPCPENVIMGVNESTQIIEGARKGHPEWLSGLRG